MSSATNTTTYTNPSKKVINTKRPNIVQSNNCHLIMNFYLKNITKRKSFFILIN
jgi:hypothetical protein